LTTAESSKSGAARNAEKKKLVRLAKELRSVGPSKLAHYQNPSEKCRDGRHRRDRDGLLPLPAARWSGSTNVNEGYEVASLLPGKCGENDGKVRKCVVLKSLCACGTEGMVLELVDPELRRAAGFSWLHQGPHSKFLGAGQRTPLRSRCRHSSNFLRVILFNFSPYTFDFCIPNFFTS